MDKYSLNDGRDIPSPNTAPGGVAGSGLIGSFVGSIFGKKKTTGGPMPGRAGGPLKLTYQPYKDDYRFCRNFDGMNIAITGATGTIGSMVVQELLRSCQPRKVGLFCRDEEKLPPELLERARVPPADPQKQVYTYEVDFVDALKVTNKTHAMLRNFEGRLDAIFFCHGVINFMGGVDGNLPEWDLIQKINVRSTMHILSISMPFLRLTKGSATILSSSAGEKPWPGHTIYNTAMASLNMMVRCAALENACHGVRVNAVAPGYVRSETARSNPEFHNALTRKQNQAIIAESSMNTPLLGYVPPKLAEEGEGIYIYQITEPEDVAAQLLWLGSNHTSFISGEVLIIDGGLHITSNGYE